MQWRGLVHHRLNEVPYGMLALAFFVAALWYFILVQHSDHARWRWARRDCCCPPAWPPWWD
jgi:hypothetical protein